MTYCDQSAFEIRFEWGLCGVDAVGAGCRRIVVVDVLSFSTCVEIALSRGTTILPFGWNDASATQFALDNEAILATKDRRSANGYSLSPTSLAQVPAGLRLVLPSPNGATVTLRAGQYGPTATACLRNAAAVARWAQGSGGPVAVIACGERWADGTLRPSWEDLVGAGAVIEHFAGSLSPEAETARDAYRQAAPDIARGLSQCSSGRELIERGFGEDLEWSSALNISRMVPVLRDNAFAAAPAE